MATKTVMDAIQQALQTAAVVKHSAVYIHAGKFTWNELKRRGFNAPALFISCLGWKDGPEHLAAHLQSEIAVDARFAIGIVTSNAKNPEARNIEARVIAEQITLLLINQDWSLDNCLAATNRRSEGLFVPAAEQENCSMWMVTWNQIVGLTRTDLQASIDDWLRYTADHYDPNDSEHIMATDTVEIPQE